MLSSWIKLFNDTEMYEVVPLAKPHALVHMMGQDISSKKSES